MAAESTGLPFKIESEILTDLCNFVKLTFFFYSMYSFPEDYVLYSKLAVNDFLTTTTYLFMWKKQCVRIIMSETQHSDKLYITNILWHITNAMTSYHYECNVSEFFTQRVETVLQRYSQQCDLKGRGDRSNSGESTLVCAELRSGWASRSYQTPDICLWK